jgi:NADH-quinone oxidoreductase subunit J
MITFAALSIILVASAVFAIAAKSPVHSVVGLLVNFMALAVLYLSLSAEFIAFIQILVYSGAILILFVFVIALLSSGIGPFNVGPDRLPKLLIPGTILSALALGLVIRMLANTSFTPEPRIGIALGPIGTANVFGSIGDFGRALFTLNLLPFEVTAFILLVAVIGVVLVTAGEPRAMPQMKIHRKARKREAIVKEHQ